VAKDIYVQPRSLLVQYRRLLPGGRAAVATQDFGFRQVRRDRSGAVRVLDDG
jgi:hypothetical protein